MRHTRGIASALLSLVLLSCHSRQERALTLPAQARALDRRSEYLKAHMRDGHVYILQDWRVDAAGTLVTGTGEHQDSARRTVERGTYQIQVSQVALFETNVISTSPSVSALAVVTGISTAVTVACLSNPKACFGSCPTFYVGDGEREVLQAEGFSASVAPSLEATDLDALYRARVKGRELLVRMTNEALETHVVKYVEVRAARRPPGGRVLAAKDGTFWQTTSILSPLSCAGPEGDCLTQVRAVDALERQSAADEHDLSTKEDLELVFPPQEGAVGLILGTRQTLLSTFVFYQGLAYMGSTVGRWMASLERGKASVSRARSLLHLLGGVEVFVQDAAGSWRRVDELGETGPLADDIRLVRLPDGIAATGAKLRLRMTRGHIRLGYVALAGLGKSVDAIRLTPARIDAHVNPHYGPGRPVPASFPMTTLPGDEVRLHFTLPEDGENLELFLLTRGYYLEWMRDEWTPEENPARAALLVVDPATALRLLAPAFKKREAEMESLFWRSRYVRP
jgi:hypothetical protein